MNEKDKATVDLLFEISQNEGERHGKMPDFSKTSTPKAPKKEDVIKEQKVEEPPVIEEPPVVEEPPKQAPKQPSRRRGESEDEVVSVVKA